MTMGNEWIDREEEVKEEVAVVEGDDAPMVLQETQPRCPEPDH